MTLRQLQEVLDARLVVGGERPDLEVSSVCGRLYEAGLRSGGVREMA